MDMISLKAAARSAEKPKKLRRSGIVPAVVYGFEVKNLQIECNETALHKALVAAGESTLVELDVEGKKIPVLFKEITFDPVSEREVHADFYAVNMKQEIDTMVPVHFEGESLAIKELGGVFVVAHETVKVRCLPSNLPHNLVASVTGLAAFHDTLTIKDLQVPKGVTIMDVPETVIASVQEPRKEEIIAPVVSAEAPAEGAEATAEGAAPAAGVIPGNPEGPGAPAAKEAKEKK